MGHWELYHMHSMRVCFPLQQKENRGLSEKLSAVDKTHAMERERLSKETENLRRSEQEARAKAERFPSLLEQLSFLQHELENTRREKDDLEEQTKIYKEHTQQVGLPHSHLSLSTLTVWQSHVTLYSYFC